MKPPTRIATLPLRPRTSFTQRIFLPTRPVLPASVAAPGRSPIHTTVRTTANTMGACGIGPAPPPPEQPASEQLRQRVERKKRHAEMLKQAREGKAGLKRFWRQATFKEVDDHLEVFLDSRPLRRPGTSHIILIPRSKPQLAAAIALEWDMLTSAQGATKEYMVPLTALTCRVADIAADDASNAPTIRAQITDMVMAFLDTDTLLCWAEQPEKDDPMALRNEEGESLHEVQERTAGEVASWLVRWVWPGVVLRPSLGQGSIMPVPQTPETKAVVAAWVWSLSAWELAGLERATLAGKSLLVAARLVVEWAERFRTLRATIREQEEGGGGKVFGIEEAASAVSLEVDWQIANWGQVEDTHDVQREDVRRQLGSVILLVSGTGQS